MATYKVQGSQNIWDISLLLYGTIEGAFDLFISNDWLTMTTDLVPGMELEYHEDFVVNEGIVNSLHEQNLVPANSERHVYYKEISTPLRIIVELPAIYELVSFKASGDGEMIIDWGDNTECERVQLTPTVNTYEHYFDNHVDARKIKLYGDFSFRQFDFTDIDGNMFPVKPIVVDQFISHANSSILSGLLLFEGTYMVDLQYSDITDLSPLYDMSLQELNLLNCNFSTLDVLDDYLENLVTNHGNRRSCIVYIDTTPSTRGMDAINTIINEPAWNTPTKWEFHINGEIYKKE